ncbi:MAG TPA: guanylate kinase [Candidatus Baltobacterales bacterium]|nr:guanylate kinase [Candidatus Baltobacterales bacterium]
MRRGLLIVISGPSGVGKDTIIQRLLELDSNLKYSVSCTTRSPRAGEVDGENYTFLTHEKFEQMVQEGAFLEHATYNGHLYGTLRERVDQARGEGRDIVLKIEVKGAEKVREREPAGLFIFVVAPSLEELERRQKLRNSETAKDMASRRKIAESEMTYAQHYDHVVVNDELERTAREILGIIQAARRGHT